MKWLTGLWISRDPHFHVEVGGIQADGLPEIHLMWGLRVTTIWLPTWLEFQGKSKIIQFLSKVCLYTEKFRYEFTLFFFFLFLVLSLSFSVIITVWNGRLSHFTYKETEVKLSDLAKITQLVVCKAKQQQVFRVLSPVLWHFQSNLEQYALISFSYP